MLSKAVQDALEYIKYQRDSMTLDEYYSFVSELEIELGLHVCDVDDERNQLEDEGG